MLAEIKKELQRLEVQQDIRILYAVESGSRAWGFPSLDSDWDVRYIYIHRLDWYLQIDEKKDSREEILTNKIDLAGWDLKKTLKLFRKSNPPLLEWLNSPIIYLEKYSITERLRSLIKEFFNPKSCIHHYLHMAEGNFREYLQMEIVRAKKYFYVLRPILACDYIRQTNSMAPMEFQKLLETQVKDQKLKTTIIKLLTKKMKGEELDGEPKIQILNDFLNDKINFYNNYVKSYDRGSQPDNSLLNDLFKQSINEVWDLALS